MVKRIIIRAIPINEVSTNADTYSEAEFMAWKDTRSTIESELYGNLAIKFLDAISYFDNKFVVPTAIFTESNSDKALKLLAEKNLITFQNDSKEFTIYKPFQMINTQKLKLNHLESDALESAVQLLESVMNLPEYSNQNSIFLIDHEISVWNYVIDCETCENVIRKHANFPKVVLIKLINDLDSPESVQFGEKSTKRYQEVFGVYDKNTLFVETLTGVSYDLIKDYDKSLSVLNKIIIDYKNYSEKYDEIYLLAKYGKANALLESEVDTKYGIALLDEVINQAKVKLGEADLVTLTASSKKIGYTYTQEDDNDNAIDIVNDVLPIVIKYDANSERVITLQLKLQKAMLLAVLKQYELSENLFDEIKSKIIYTDRGNIMEFAYNLVKGAALVEEEKFTQALHIVNEVKEMANMYLPKDDHIFNELDEFLDFIPVDKVKRSVNNHAPMDHLHIPDSISKIKSFSYFYDFKNNCLIEGRKLIENLNVNNGFITKPIVSASISNTFNLVFLIDVFLKKITGNKYGKSIDVSFVPSKYSLNAAVINICARLENVFFNTLKNPEQFDYSELQSVLRNALEKCSNNQELNDILRNYIHQNMIHTENNADLSTLHYLIEHVIKNACDE